MKKKRPKKKLITTLAVIGGVVLLLGLMEFSLRIVEHNKPGSIVQGFAIAEPSQDPELEYELEKNVKNFVFRGAKISTNSGGFRSEEVPEQKNPSKYRIMFLGDSLTFGLGVDIENTFIKKVEKVVKEKGYEGRLEAINLAIPGYSLEQQQHIFYKYYEQYDPDLVIVTYSLEETDFETKDISKDTPILEDTYIYQLLKGEGINEKNTIYLDRFHSIQDYASYLRARMNTDEFKEHVSIMQNMENKLLEKNRRLLVYLVPTLKKEYLLNQDVRKVYDDLQVTLRLNDIISLPVVLFSEENSFEPGFKEKIESFASDELSDEEKQELLHLTLANQITDFIIVDLNL